MTRYPLRNMNENNSVKSSHPSRRDFLKLGGVMTAGLVGPKLVNAELAAPVSRQSLFFRYFERV